jgi:hypothetical protein
VTRRVAAAVVAAATVLVLLAGCPDDSPEGAVCADGSSLYSSEHGNFICRDGRWIER